MHSAFVFVKANALAIRILLRIARLICDGEDEDESSNHATASIAAGDLLA